MCCYCIVLLGDRKSLQTMAFQGKSVENTSSTANNRNQLDDDSSDSSSASSAPLKTVDISSSTATNPNQSDDNSSDSSSDSSVPSKSVEIRSSTATNRKQSDDNSALLDKVDSDNDDVSNNKPNEKSPFSKKQRTKPPPSRVGMQYAYFCVTSDNNHHWILTNYVCNKGPDLIKVLDADTDDRRFIFQSCLNCCI